SCRLLFYSAPLLGRHFLLFGRLLAFWRFGGFFRGGRFLFGRRLFCFRLGCRLSRPQAGVPALAVVSRSCSRCGDQYK
ncbi:MAG TPA: hypothetical protein VIH71_03580, partial [Solirubrobacteraceae bacterium]